MKRITYMLALLAIALRCAADDNLDKQNNAIMATGKYLYHLEQASSYAADIFMTKADKHADPGGYFSYPAAGGIVCIFYDKQQPANVIGTISFDSTYDPGQSLTNFGKRAMTRVEKELYTLRNAAMAVVADDTFFRFFQNTYYSYIPLAEGKERKVYIITRTSLENTVVFGNDYELSFDRYNELRNKAKLHPDIITLEYGKQGPGQGVIHNHTAGMSELLTPTDVCILMLYEQRANWTQHMVIAPNYVSIWDCKTNQVHTVTRAAAEGLVRQAE